MIDAIRCVSIGVMTTPANCRSTSISFCSIKNKKPRLNSVQVKNTETSKNTGTIFGHTIMKNTAVNAIILLVHWNPSFSYFRAFSIASIWNFPRASSIFCSACFALMDCPQMDITPPSTLDPSIVIISTGNPNISLASVNLLFHRVSFETLIALVL